VLRGSNALAYGAESVVEVAREIVALAKQHEEIELKGAVLDGILFEGDAGVRKLADYPTKDEAIAQDVTLILGPGRKLVGAVKGPGGRLGRHQGDRGEAREGRRDRQGLRNPRAGTPFGPRSGTSDTRLALLAADAARVKEKAQCLPLSGANAKPGRPSRRLRKLVSR
jgi:hypothetical protein